MMAYFYTFSLSTSYIPFRFTACLCSIYFEYLASVLYVLLALISSVFNWKPIISGYTVSIFMICSTNGGDLIEDNRSNHIFSIAQESCHDNQLLGQIS